IRDRNVTGVQTCALPISLWESTPSSIQDAGYKTDVYLRALGSLHDSNLQTLIDIHTHLDELKLRQFALQLFTLLEDIRLEEAIKKKRDRKSTRLNSSHVSISYA